VRSVPLLNHVKIHGPDIAKVLEPGERLVALGIYRGPHHPDTRGLDPQPGQDKLFELGQFNTQIFNRLLSGSAGSGGPDSYAGTMWRAGTAMGPGIVHWAVTDRRFLLLRRPWTIGFALPLSAVRSARRRFQPLFGWGQVEVTFADGSMLAILAGLLDVGLANRLIRALTDRHPR
jgi:hypothetical protein